jgi:LEA14-like dessication related protein
LLLAGCSSNSAKIAVPKLSLVQVAMTSADIFNQQFLVRLRVENPNTEELPVTKIEYELFLEGDSFAEGTSTRPFVVPAEGEADFDMTVRSHFVSSLGRLVTRLNGRTQVSYVFEGTAFSNLSGAKKIPFQESGTVELKYMK